MDEAITFARKIGDSPALLWPGRSRRWWAGPTGALTWDDGQLLWTEREDSVIAFPIKQPDVTPLADGILARDPRGLTVHIGTRSWNCRDKARRDGADVRLERVSGRWRSQHVVVPDIEASPHPWRIGRGLVWAADGFLYRHDGTTRAIGTVEPGAHLDIGPEGAVLVGDGVGWYSGAAPHRSLAPLAEPLDAKGWGVRWAPDGAMVAGIDDHGNAVHLDLRHGTVARHPGTLPLDTVGTHLDALGQLVHAAGVHRAGLAETSWAFDGVYLGGPGGVIWDLGRGTPCFTAPRLRFGATVATSRLWASVDWESGAGVWVEPATGAVVASFQVPLARGDTIATGVADSDVAVFTTERRKFFVSDGNRVSETSRTPPETPALPRSGPGWSLRDRALVTDRFGVFLLPVEAAVRVRDQLWAWNTDGLLVAIPM